MAPECRSKKHKEKLQALREALSEDAALGSEDLLSDLPATAAPAPAAETSFSSKQQLRAAVHASTSSTTARTNRQPSSHAPQRGPSQPSEASGSPLESEASEGNLSEDAMLNCPEAAQQHSKAASQSDEEDNEMSEEAMLARLIAAQQGGAGPSQSDDESEEGMGEWERVHYPSVADCDASVAEGLQDLGLQSDAEQACTRKSGLLQRPAAAIDQSMNDHTGDSTSLGSIQILATKISQQAETCHLFLCLVISLQAAVPCQ